MKKILIVGGVAGGASAAARIRRLDEKCEIIMFEKGEFISFANCGLPYYIGGAITDKDELTLQTPDSFKKRFNVDVRIFSEVIEISKDNKTVKVRNLKTGESYEESYDVLILSPGAKPVKPNIFIENDKRVFTLRNIPDTLKIKEYISDNNVKSAAVIGGGYIGTEMAENLYNLGLNVTIVEMSDHLIAPLDYDMAADVHNHIRRKGVKIILNERVNSIVSESNGLKIKLSDSEFNADIAVLAVGVKPDTEFTGDAVNKNERGAIISDSSMQSSDSFIYAIGDAIEITDFITGNKGYIPLAGPANKQGRIAADNICGFDSEYEGTMGTSILKCFDLTVATTGITERKAKELNLNYEKSFTYSPSHATYYKNPSYMSIKIIFEKESGLLLGAQIIGYEGVDKRMDILSTAMHFKATVFDLTKLELSYAPPYSSAKDPVNMAGYVAENILTGKSKVFHHDEALKLPKDGSVTLLDVRTRMEYSKGTIDGFINIPLDEIRENIDKLDKNKPVYLTCQIGLRGYIASRILTQYGFDCYNLSGGIRLYKSIYNISDR